VATVVTQHRRRARSVHGLILVVGVVLAVLGLPAAATFLLRRTLPIVFAAYGTVSAVCLYTRWRDRRDTDPGERPQTP